MDDDDDDDDDAPATIRFMPYAPSLNILQIVPRQLLITPICLNNVVGRTSRTLAPSKKILTAPNSSVPQAELKPSVNSPLDFHVVA